MQSNRDKPFFESTPIGLSLVIIGCEDSGRNALMTRYIDGSFTQLYLPMRDNYFRKLINYQNILINLQLCRVTKENLLNIEKLRRAHGYLVTVDVTNLADFKIAAQIILSLQQNCASSSILVIGTKCENQFDRAITPQQLLKLTQDFKLPAPIETSAMDNENITLAFDTAIKLMMQRYAPKNRSVSSEQTKTIEHVDKKTCSIN